MGLRGRIEFFAKRCFFGIAGYVCAVLARDFEITSILIMLPASIVVGTVASFFIGIFVFVGRHVPSMVFIAVTTLSASFVFERLARGWAYIGGQNGIPSLPRLTIGSFEIEEGMIFYYLAAFHFDRRLCVVASDHQIATRTRVGFHSRG